jgi:diguanylate cyclase (GGDEF)-like protein
MKSNRLGLKVAILLFYTIAFLLILMPELLSTRGAELFTWIFYTFTMLLYGVLAFVAVTLRPSDERVTLFVVLGFMVSLTLLMDAAQIGSGPVFMQVVLQFLYSGVYMMIAPVVVHMAAVIPRRHRLLERYPYILPLTYVTGALLTLSYFAVGVSPLVPAFQRWSAAYGSLVLAANPFSYVVAGGLGLAFLANAARNEPDIQGRRQALVMFAGLLPWTVNITLHAVLDDAYEHPLLTIAEPVIILFVAVCFFLAIVRYRLFGLGVVIRRGFIYASAGGLLAAGLYLSVTAVTAFARDTFGVQATFWSVALLLLLGGASIQPLLKGAGRVIDRRFFHEKLALETLEQSIIPELADCSSLKAASSHLTRRLREVLNADTVSLLLSDPSEEFYRIRSIATSDARPIPPIVLTRADLAIWRPELERGSPFDAHSEAPPTLATAMESLEALRIVPVLFRKRIIGFLTIGRSLRGGDLDPTDLKRLQTIARQASAMLENTRLFELATYDPLTRLPRRQVATERLEAEIERARRIFHPFAVAIADLDDFKRINDTYGHQCGDGVLIAAADLLARASRSIDLVARYGGEEFLFVLPETDPAGAAAHMERLCEEVGRLEIRCADVLVSITLSIGLCVVETEQDLGSAPELIRIADDALYAAKRAGKNRVVTRRRT